MKTLTVITPIVCCSPGTPPIARSDAEALADRFQALSDPTRVGIVNQLAVGGEVCVCDLTAAFDLSQPTISHHLRVLRDVGLVAATKRGTWSFYRLVPEAVEPLRIALGATS
jgi:ArsR family transcriptional regulator